jgi:hypothetical protein
MTVKKEICIMGLIGLPGAGKTTFCRAYAQHLARKGSAVKLVVVSLDELIPLERQAAAVGDDQRTFKRWREQIAAAVDFHIERATKESSGLNIERATNESSCLHIERATEDSSGLHIERATKESSGLHIGRAIPESSGLHIERATKESSGLHIERATEESSGLHIEGATKESSGLHIERATKESSGLHIERATKESSGLHIERATDESSGLHIERATKESSGLHIERATDESSGLSDASSIAQKAKIETSRADIDSSANGDIKHSSTVNVSNEESSSEHNEFLDKISLDTESGKILVIVDDNNYLRSMRYLYHQVRYPLLLTILLLFFCCTNIFSFFSQLSLAV